MPRNLVIYVLSAILLVIVFPTVYVAILNEVVPHPGLSLSTQWIDCDFTENWRITMSAEIEGDISSENGVLNITINGARQEGAIVAAQRDNGLPDNITSKSFLKVSIKTSSIDVAARVLVWSNESFSSDYLVLLKTYDDQEWHTEIIDLSLFDFSGQLFRIELSMMQVCPSNSSEWVSYSQLSFEEMEV